MSTLDRLIWPSDEPADVLHALARASGARVPDVARAARGSVSQQLSLEESATRLGIHLSRVAPTFSELGAHLLELGPGVVAVGDASGGGYLAVVGARGRRLRLLDPSGQIHRVDVEEVRRLLASSASEALRGWIDDVLPETSARRRGVLLDRLTDAYFGDQRTHECWTIVPSPAPTLARDLLRAGALPLIAGHALAQAAHVLGLIALWSVLGALVLGGRSNEDLLVPWLALAMTLAPLQVAEIWCRTRLAVTFASAIRDRLIWCSVHRSAASRHEAEGPTGHTARALESEMLEMHAIAGVVGNVSAAVDLAAALVLFLGALWQPWLGLALAASSVLAIAGAARLFSVLVEWASVRRDENERTIEDLLGAATHFTQLGARRADGIPRSSPYGALAASADGFTLALTTILPKGWILVGVAGVAWAFASGSSLTHGCAILGVAMLAQRGLSSLGMALVHGAFASAAWRFVAPMLSIPEPFAPSVSRAIPSSGSPEAPVLEARHLALQYPGRTRPTLRDCSLSVREGDRICIEGRSGAGKSSLASLLCGERAPDSGLLVVLGADHRSLGAVDWKRAVGMVPQFHENHVFSGTLAFNLLLSRPWPPTPEDLEEAEEVCGELGLGDLLARMPNGIHQYVGDTGWQLSHGERSRLFLGRAILQRPKALLIDESFSALDPDALARSLDCAQKRIGTLLVIAHP